jgi:dCMP deaminase
VGDGYRYCGVHGGMPTEHVFAGDWCIYCPTPSPDQQRRTVTRPSRTETYLALAEVFSLRGTCPRAKVGCVIVDDQHVVAHGYNGAPRGLPHCDEGEGRWKCASYPGEQGCGIAVHAEANAIAYAASVGVSTMDAELYCTHEPCLRCAQLIVQAGISTVTYMKPYRLHDGKLLLERAGLQVDWHFVDLEVTFGA